MVKCIALDLDRTTLETDKSLSWGNRRALEDVIARGVHVVIASGRSFETLPQEMLAVPGIEYAITSNGAAVYHIPDKTRIKEYLLPVSAVEAILKIVREQENAIGQKIVLETFISGTAYADAQYVADPLAFGASEYALDYIKSTRNQVEDMKGFIEEHKSELDSIDVVTYDGELKAELTERFSKEVPDIYITSSIRELIEISHKDAGKHSGLKVLSERLGIQADECAAFGDADNDIDMIRYSGYGIAVANASQNCLDAADYVTKAHDEDGVAYGIYHYLPLPQKEMQKKKTKIALHISSVTGNTRKLAKGIEEYLHAAGYDVKCYDNRKKADQSCFDKGQEILHILAFWCRKSSLDDFSKCVVDQMEGQDVLAVGTLGYYPDSDYGEMVKLHATEYIEQKNHCLGVFLSQGKISEEKTNKRRNLPKTHPHYLNDEAYARHLESRKHPNKEDIYRAIQFVEEHLAIAEDKGTCFKQCENAKV